jgi:hypothetical protein
MGREIRRTAAALTGGPARAGATKPSGGGGRRSGETPEGGAGPAASRRAGGESISRVRAIVQIVLTALLLPLALYVVFGPGSFGSAARDAASALLGAIVTFWLKD